MTAETFTHHLEAIWPIIGIGLFVMILWVVLHPASKAEYDRDAQIPFDTKDDQDG
ncbi:cytochrome c oxidase cbb3-type subunit IV [Hyphomicrobium sp. 1Nfss2.1]|uniref:cbb3-type cytochrome oxidase subunit 3 n=1 Tax=unclassified Hyphomicrobium TaxID=2619925 RepID=UPI000ADD4C17|nr:cbb3-type cytochrome c oxidase subunit 3 [Hyphomicrobium sp. NDB2Meth4]